MKLWLKEQECQTFEEIEAFPIKTYHICNARPIYVTLHSCHVTWISVLWSLIWSGGKCFWGNDGKFCTHRCEFRWIGLFSKQLKCTLQSLLFSLNRKLSALKEHSVKGTQRTDLKCNESNNATRCNQVSIESSVTFRDVLRPLCSPQLPHWNKSENTVHLNLTYQLMHFYIQ